jgi:hypothetical protein
LEKESRPRQLLRTFLGIPSRLKSSPYTTYRRRTNKGHALWPICKLGLESSFEDLYSTGVLTLDDNVSCEIECEYNFEDVLTTAMKGGSTYIFENLLKIGANPSKSTLERCTDETWFELLLQYCSESDALSSVPRICDELRRKGRLKGESSVWSRVVDVVRQRKDKAWHDNVRLQQVIIQGDAIGTRSLLQEELDLNYVDPADPQYPQTLSLAVKWCPEVVHDLLEHGANADGHRGCRPLFVACDEAQQAYEACGKKTLDLGLVRLLLNWGADPNKTQVQGSRKVSNALHNILLSHPLLLELIPLLVEKGADPNVIVKRRGVNMSLPCFAMKKQHDEKVLQMLIDNGALVDGEDESLARPLEIALSLLERCWLTEKKYVQLLLNNGADAGKVDCKWANELLGNLWRGTLWRQNHQHHVLGTLRTFLEHGGPISEEDIKQLDEEVKQVRRDTDEPD